MKRKIWAVFFPGDNRINYSSLDLYRVVADQESWTSFLVMVLGGPPASMKFLLDNGSTEPVKCVQVERTSVQSTFANPLG